MKNIQDMTVQDLEDYVPRIDPTIPVGSKKRYWRVISNCGPAGSGNTYSQWVDEEYILKLCKRWRVNDPTQLPNDSFAGAVKRAVLNGQWIWSSYRPDDGGFDGEEFDYVHKEWVNVTRTEIPVDFSNHSSCDFQNRGNETYFSIG